MAGPRVLLLQVVRLEDPQASGPVCQALRRRLPGCAISLPAHYAVARVGHLAGVDDVMVMEPGFWKGARHLRTQRFDAACIAYECPSLPGPLGLEALALTSGATRLLAATGGELRGISRGKLALRVLCGTGIAGLCALFGALISLVLPALIACRCDTNRSEKRPKP